MGWVIFVGLVILGLAWVFPLAALAAVLVALAYSIGKWRPMDGVPEWGRYALVGAAGIALVGQFIIGPNTEDDEEPSSPNSQGGDGELLTCPGYLEARAEPQGGFINGVDPEYDARMDWDGDGVSCE